MRISWPMIAYLAAGMAVVALIYKCTTLMTLVSV